MCPVIQYLLIMAMATMVYGAEDAADQEFSAYVFSDSKLPFKHTNYAQNWFGYDIAYIQNPLLASGKPMKKHMRVPLPVVVPRVFKWSDPINSVANRENTWNFERRVDSKIWWPNGR